MPTKITDYMLNIKYTHYSCIAEVIADISLSVGKFIETTGYHGGWAATVEKPKGGNRYEVVAAGTGTVDGGSFINLSNGLQLKALFDNGDINVFQFGAKGDDSTDDYQALQNAFNYTTSINASSLYIPRGAYRISGKLTITTATGKSCTIKGAGTGLTIIKAIASGYTLLDVVTGQSWPGETISLDGFSLLGVDNINSNNIGFNLATSSGTSLIMGNICVRNCYCGFSLLGAQFNKYSHLLANGNTVGIRLYTSSTSQGGNNNQFDSCYVSSNVVGVMIDNGGSGELNANTFRNLVTNNNMCGLYIYGDTGYNTILGWVPEQNGGTTDWVNDTVTIYGHTISRCAMEVTNRAILKLSGGSIFLTSSPSQYATYSGRVNVTVNSLLSIEDTQIQGGIINRDDTSYVATSGRNRFGGQISQSLFPPFNTKLLIVGGANSISAATECAEVITSGVSNSVITYGNPLTGFWSGGTSASAVFVKDDDFGTVTQFTFSSGNLGVISLHAGTTAVGETVVAAFNVKATSNGLFEFNLSQSTASLKVNLRAGVWTRVILFGTTSVAPRAGYMMITAADSTGLNNPLCICRLAAGLNPSVYTRDKILNNEINAGRYDVVVESKQAAAPTTGTWEVGDVVLNLNPAASGYAGWVCVTGGTPGTWKGFGVIQA